MAVDLLVVDLATSKLVDIFLKNCLIKSFFVVFMFKFAILNR